MRYCVFLSSDDSILIAPEPRGVLVLSVEVNILISGLLSKREIEVLELVSSGYSNQEIAIKLGITSSTAKTHLRNIYLKTDKHNRANLAISFLTSKT